MEPVPIRTPESFNGGNTEKTVPTTENVQEMSISVYDDLGQPMKNVTVFFNITSGKGTLSGNAVVTDDKGYAIATVTLPTKPGATVITAIVSDLRGSPTTFKYNVIPGPPTAITLVSGDKQDGYKNLESKELVVHVTDAFQNDVGAVPVTFEVTEGGGDVYSPTTVTDITGVAKAKLGFGDGPVNRIKASISPGKSVEFVAYTLIPVKLSPLVIGANGIDLQWTKDQNANFKKYRVLRSSWWEGTEVITEIDNINTTSFRDASGKTGEGYIYYIESSMSTDIAITSNPQSVDGDLTVDLKGDHYINDIIMSRDKSMIFVSNWIETKVWFISTGNMKKVDSIMLDYQPFQLATSPDDSRLYVTDPSGGALYVYSLPSKTLIQKVNLAAELGNNGSAADVYHTANNQLFVSANDGYVVRLNATTFAAERIATGVVGSSISGRPTFIGEYGNYLYMEESLMSPNSLYKIDLGAPGTPIIAKSPHGLVNQTGPATLDPNGQFIYTGGGQKVGTSDLKIKDLMSDTFLAFAVGEQSNTIFATWNRGFLSSPYSLYLLDRTTFKVRSTLMLNFSSSRFFLSADEKFLFMVGSLSPSNKQQIHKIPLPK